MMLVETEGPIAILAATSDLLDAEEQGAETLGTHLGVAAPSDWPPEFNGSRTRAWIRQMLTSHPDEPGYASWYILADGQLAGICGYKGPPANNGEVEIGYSVPHSLQRRGYATAAVRLLAARAFRDPRVTAVAAETLPALVASQKVLARCGFALVSRRPDDELGEILRFVLAKPGNSEVNHPR